MPYKSEKKDRTDIDPANIGELHVSLGGFEKFNAELPLYIENPFNDDQVQRLRDIMSEAKARTPDYVKVPNVLEYNGKERTDPKKIVHMSRQMIEFDCPQDIIDTMNSYAKPLFKEQIDLCHYNYIHYSPEYGEGQYAPSLPPHVDADENIVTFNFQLDSNIDDWDVWIADQPYQLKNRDALIFSAVNQVHWRGKRKWKQGESVEIISFDYCLPSSYRFTGKENPLDPFLFPETRQKYARELNSREEFKKAWKIYHEEGLKIGIPVDKQGELLD